MESSILYDLSIFFSLFFSLLHLENKTFHKPHAEYFFHQVSSTVPEPPSMTPFPTPSLLILIEFVLLSIFSIRFEYDFSRSFID